METEEEILSKAHARLMDLRAKLPQSLATETPSKFAPSLTSKTACVRCGAAVEERFVCADCDSAILDRQRRIEERDTTDQIDGALLRSGLPSAYREGHRSYADVRFGAAVTAANRVLTGAVDGLYLFGPAGPDKTTLAAVTLAQHIRNGGTGRFVSSVDLVADILGTYHETAELTRNDIVRPLIDAQALVIDDLGKEKASEHTAAVLYQIIDGRYRLLTPNSKRWLIVTSNHSLDQIGRRFTEDFGDPIRRRLAEMTLELRMTV